MVASPCLHKEFGVPRTFIAYLIFALSGLGIFQADAQGTADLSRSIVVVGEGESAGTPDVAIVTVGVSQDAESARLALQSSNQLLFAALRPPVSSQNWEVLLSLSSQERLANMSIPILYIRLDLFYG